MTSLSPLHTATAPNEASQHDPVLLFTELDADNRTHSARATRALDNAVQTTRIFVDAVNRAVDGTFLRVTTFDDQLEAAEADAATEHEQRLAQAREDIIDLILPLLNGGYAVSREQLNASIESTFARRIKFEFNEAIKIFKSAIRAKYTTVSAELDVLYRPLAVAPLESVEQAEQVIKQLVDAQEAIAIKKLEVAAGMRTWAPLFYGGRAPSDVTMASANRKGSESSQGQADHPPPELRRADAYTNSADSGFDAQGSRAVHATI